MGNSVVRHHAEIAVSNEARRRYMRDP